jgi:hypothetical protein
VVSRPKPEQILDLTGKKFGFLTVLKLAGHNKHGEAMWLTECERDGNQTIVRGVALRSGKTKSCGCLQKEMKPANINDLTGKTFGRLTVNPAVHSPDERRAVPVRMLM